MRRPSVAALVAMLAGALPALAAGAAMAQGPGPGPVFAPESSGTASLARTVIAGTARADVIAVHQDGDGSLRVSVNGGLTLVPAGEVSGLVIDGGAGRDTITAEAGVTTALTIFGGAGDDVIIGGAGNDVIYGGPGNDRITSGAGAAYIDGGLGNDRLSAAGPAMLLGGAGDDQLSGGAGGLMAGGPGADTYSGGNAATRVFAQRGEPVGSSGKVVLVSLSSRDAAGRLPGSALRINGTTAFAQQVASDVTTLLSLPEGRRLLTALDAAGRAVSLKTSSSGNRTTIPNPAAAFLRPGGVHGPGSASSVFYDPYETVIENGAQAWQSRPPVVGLCHELIHAANAAGGTLQPGTTTSGVPKLELQAIGLPFKGVAFRFGPGSPLSSGNPRYLTENGLRALLGLPARTAY